MFNVNHFCIGVVFYLFLLQRYSKNRIKSPVIRYLTTYLTIINTLGNVVIKY